MVPNLMMLAKMATLGLLKKKVFRNNDFIIAVYDVINKNLSGDPNFIVDMVM